MIKISNSESSAWGKSLINRPLTPSLERTRKRIDEITREIRVLNSNTGVSLIRVGARLASDNPNSYSEPTVNIRIGGLLREAKDEYAGPTAKGFIEWAESEFGFKKSYTYKLMKVHAKFGTDPVLSGVPVAVLGMLAGQGEDKLQEARKLAEKGQLDHTSVKALTQSDPIRCKERLAPQVPLTPPHLKVQSHRDSQMIKQVTLYQTADGINHSSEQDAKRHSEDLVYKTLDEFINFAFGENNLNKPAAFKAAVHAADNHNKTIAQLRRLLHVMTYGSADED